MNMTRILFWGLGLLAFVLFIRLWVGPASYPDIRRLEQQIEQQNAANDEQAEIKRKLQMDVVGLSKDDEAVEEHARSELGMVRQGETFYQVILKSDPVATLPVSQAKAAPNVE
ncbi:FtsB family cell division protein [Thiothrix caldifontis]|nr:septum formation initiator family protein [Thiothrix caldifontis]